MDPERLENELNRQKKSLEYLNRLESKCEGLENLLCKNVIKVISKKIDNIEKKFTDKLEINKLNNIGRKRTEDPESRKIEKLNNNIGIIENVLINNPISPDITTNELIARKIEENYKLLDELEKTNRPIFIKSEENKNRVFVEDKIREMDNKLGSLFSAYRERNKALNSGDDSRKVQNEFKREITFKNSGEISRGYTALSPEEEKQRREKIKEEKLRELHDKLSGTEKKIKEIAGTILKNF